MNRRAALLGAVALAAAALVGLPVTSAAAAPTPYSACSTTEGTLVAVDFGHFGGPIVRGCDTTPPKHGIDLLTDQGFRTTGTQHDGPQFVCRIGNQAFSGGTQYPTPAQDPCVTTPPASAYWSYWLAEPGDTSWHYSQYGAFSNQPRTGEIQLWIFGGTDIQGSQGNPTNGFPTCSPASLRSGDPTPCTPHSGGGSGGGSGGSGGGGSGGGSHGGSGGGTTAGSGGGTTASGRHASGTGAPAHRTPSSATSRQAAASTAARTSARPTTPAAPSTATGTAPSSTGPSAAAGGVSSGGTPPGGAIAVDAKPASKHTSSGSALPLVLGLALAVLFAIGGGWVVRRRRLGTE